MQIIWFNAPVSVQISLELYSIFCTANKWDKNYATINSETHLFKEVNKASLKKLIYIYFSASKCKLVVMRYKWKCLLLTVFKTLGKWMHWETKVIQQTGMFFQWGKVEQWNSGTIPRRKELICHEGISLWRSGRKNLSNLFYYWQEEEEEEEE